jgi:hypothetical protein
MEIVYVGLDMGSSGFQQVAIKTDGSIKVNRSFTTSEANLRAAFADQRGEIHVHLEAGELAPWAASVIAPLVTRVVCRLNQIVPCTRPHRTVITRPSSKH